MAAMGGCGPDCVHQGCCDGPENGYYSPFSQKREEMGSVVKPPQPAAQPSNSAYTGMGSQPQVQPPLVGGVQAARPPRGGNMPQGGFMSGGYVPSMSLSTNQGFNVGQNQSQNQSNNVSQSTNRSGSYVDPTKLGLYNQLLGLNQQNYSNVLNAFNTGQDELRGNLAGAYGQLPSIQNTLGMGQVLGANGNWGVADPAARAIAANQAQGAANINQQMRRSGLGNTTAVGNLQAQNTAQANNAYGALGADLAGRAAAYQQQGINTQMQGAGMQADAAWRRAGALGQQFSNTFGNLDSSFGMGDSMSQGTSLGSSYGWNMGQNSGMSLNQVGQTYGGDLQGLGMQQMDPMQQFGAGGNGGWTGGGGVFQEGPNMDRPYAGPGFGGGGDFGMEPVPNLVPRRQNGNWR